MQAEEFEHLYELEETFWWFVGMRYITDAVIDRYLPASRPIKVLDAGCGTGFNIEHFSLNRARSVMGFDFSSDAIGWVRKRGFDNVCEASITEIPFASSTFDLVVSFEVLCQDGVELTDFGLREIYRVLRPGGFFFVRLPAFRWMRSSHDVAVATSRRFTRPELINELAKAGLKTEWISYANCFLFPVVIVSRILKAIGIGAGSDVRPLPGPIAWLDPIFRGILKLEGSLFRSGVVLPFGLSVICVAQKPTEL